MRWLTLLARLAQLVFATLSAAAPRTTDVMMRRLMSDLYFN
jgi:hypothetical protein